MPTNNIYISNLTIYSQILTQTSNIILLQVK